MLTGSNLISPAMLTDWTFGKIASELLLPCMYACGAPKHPRQGTQADCKWVLYLFEMRYAGCAGEGGVAVAAGLAPRRYLKRYRE